MLEILRSTKEPDLLVEFNQILVFKIYKNVCGQLGFYFWKPFVGFTHKITLKTFKTCSAFDTFINISLNLYVLKLKITLVRLGSSNEG